MKRDADESQHQPLLAEHLLVAPHSHFKQVLSKQDGTYVVVGRTSKTKQKHHKFRHSAGWKSLAQVSLSFLTASYRIVQDSTAGKEDVSQARTRAYLTVCKAGSLDQPIDMLDCLVVCFAVPGDTLKGCIQITRIVDLPGLVDDLPWDDVPVLETVKLPFKGSLASS